MNYNNYFKLFYLLNKNNLIEENTKIFPVLKDKIILSKNIIKKEKEVEFFICEIILENDKILLIEDLPLNFLISHTLLIGENCKLFEFKSNNKTYISQENLIELFEEVTDKKEISTKEIFNLKFKTNYKELEIIKHLKSYLSQYKKIDFNKVHIIKNDKIENFVPTGKSIHLNLAKEMNIPTTNLIENNYIKNTNINIYDNDKIKEILNPIKIVNKKTIVKICKKNKLNLFNDINTNFYIKVPYKKITKIIENLKETNFDKEQIIKEILNKNKIKLSSNYGKYYLPIWKSISNQKYLEIENINDFEELSGMIFRDNTENFKDLYLQYKGGEQAIFKNKFLKNEFNKIIESIKKEENIEFENIEELILKLIFNEKTKIKTISKIENFDVNLITKTINNTNYILKHIITNSIKENKLPQKTNSHSNIEIYLTNITYLITKLKTDFENSGDKKTLIVNLFEITTNIKKLIKNISHTNEIFHTILKNINLIIQILENINSKKIEELKENYNEYFKNYKFTYEKYPKINFGIINLINDINKTNSLKIEYSILIKNTNLNQQYFNSKNFLKSEPDFKEYIKPNNKLLKKIFKYNFKEIIDQIKKIDLDVVEIESINVNNTEIELKKEYFEIYHKYSKYKIILENEYFLILTQK